MSDKDKRSIVDGILDISKELGLPDDAPIEEVFAKFFEKYRVEPSEGLKAFITRRDRYMREGKL